MAGTKSPILTPLYGGDPRFIQVALPLGIGEGGWSNRKNDLGGETNLGISLRFLKAEGAFIDLDHDGHSDLDLDFDGDLDGADIRALTPAAAKNLFYLCFWKRFRLGELPKLIDGAVLDQAVNGGATAAVKMLQRACNRFAIKPDLKDDGDLGNQTRARVWEIRALDHGLEKLVLNYRQEAEARYNAIVRAKPAQVENLKGWISRARSLGSV